ncbi:hypothetical protein V5799_024219, partial [Amblyomma americanum]
RSVQQEQDCSKIEECYGRLRKHFQRELDGLPGSDPTKQNFVEYRRFCGTLFQSDSPCSRFDDFKECSKQPGIEAREKVYEQVRGFVCADNETSWKRFMGIKAAQTNDACKGALEATRQVLSGKLDECGTVKKLFGECAAQQHLLTDQLETGMDLLGCQQQAPTTPAPQPGPGHHKEPQCHEDEARRCLNEAVMDLATSFGFKQGDVMQEQPACTDPDQSCLQKHPLDDCIDQSMQLGAIQTGIENVRRAACADNRDLLKKIRKVASCYDLEAFVQCLNTGNVHIEGTMLSPEQCRSILATTNGCIDKSRKSCAKEADASVVEKLPSTFLEVYACQPYEVPGGGDAVSPTAGVPPAKPPKGSGVSLSSSLTLALCVALFAAFASQH